MQQMGEKRGIPVEDIKKNWNTLKLILYNLTLKQFPWDEAGAAQNTCWYSHYEKNELWPVTYDRFSFHM